MTNPKKSCEKKYLCVGGNVISANDGELHYISPYRLAELYQVNPEECYFVKDEDSEMLHGLRTDELIELRPRFDGEYSTYKKGKEDGK